MHPLTFLEMLAALFTSAACRLWSWSALCGCVFRRTLCKTIQPYMQGWRHCLGRLTCSSPLNGNDTVSPAKMRYLNPLVACRYTDEGLVESLNP